MPTPVSAAMRSVTPHARAVSGEDLGTSLSRLEPLWASPLRVFPGAFPLQWGGAVGGASQMLGFSTARPSFACCPVDSANRSVPLASSQAAVGGKPTVEITSKCASPVWGDGQATSKDREARMTWNKL